MSRNQRPMLIVDDSDEDYDVLLDCFSRQNLKTEILRCASGDLVLQTLENRYQAKLPPPALIILDLNIIGTDGREVLRMIKTSPLFASIPVLVFSTSSSPKDIEACYRLGANSYTVKPVDLQRFEDFIAAVKHFWFDNSVLPVITGYEQDSAYR